MKNYNKYMNSITVSDSLHKRLVSCTSKNKQRYSKKRLTPIFACFLAVLCVLTVTIYYQTHSDTGTLPDSSTSNYTLLYNKASECVSCNKIAIKGHFWSELNESELKAVFPRLTEHSITATVNYSSSNNEATIYNIEARTISKTGLKSYIQVALNKIELDYSFDVEAEKSSILETEITAGYYEGKPNSKGISNIVYFANFQLLDKHYYVQLGGNKPQKQQLEQEFTSLIATLVKGGAADMNVFNPVIPELRDDKLSLSEARSDIDFGKYLLVKPPKGFAFMDAYRFINQVRNSLSASWSKGLNHVNWRVSYLSDSNKKRMTNIEDKQNYDLSLYPIPRVESVPQHLWGIVDNPIFKIEDLTLEVVKARTYFVEDAGDINGPRMSFSVLYGDVLVEITIKGVSADVIYETLKQIEK